jgi:hypothetical protein
MTSLGDIVNTRTLVFHPCLVGPLVLIDAPLQITKQILLSEAVENRRGKSHVS